MCENCAENHEIIMEHVYAEMDEQEVPQDSILRGLANIQIACEHSPVLKALMTEMYPSQQTLTS